MRKYGYMRIFIKGIGLLFIIIFVFVGCSKYSVKNMREYKEKASNTENINPTSLSTPECCEIYNQSQIENYIKHLLQDGSKNVNIMALGFPEEEKEKRLYELTMKFQTGAQANPSWFLEYSKSIAPGAEMPYHPNLGMTKEEFEEYKILAESTTMVKKGTGTISIETDDKNKIEIKNINGLRLINNIVLDLTNNTISTDYGICTYKGTIDSSDDQKVTGRWNGHSWELEESNIDLNDISEFDKNTSIKLIQFSIGQLEKTNEVIVYYEVKIIENGKRVSTYETITF
ncbi:hypothetical protein [Acetivibrio cellulolyticus]|uniref:hypothetical protein n=1 Tax=Acetivibrio cellulolyticus TaxID=35830 RepID=UPI0001E2F5AE|nr:hypothetical protein [Acetivibrio cellulolyticus]